MRVGFNPQKGKLLKNTKYFHQVVIPVYIPSQEGYFKDNFEILKLCLTSLFRTAHIKTFITIVNNGSCTLIGDYLNILFKEGKVQEVIHTQNIGRVNANLKGISGNKFPVVTLADADVLFLNNWQEETYAVFDSFPKAGAVCPTPSSRSLRTYTSNIYWDCFFSKRIKIREVVNPRALKDFAISVGNINFYNSIQLKKYLIVNRNNLDAVVGAGHFLTTYRESVLTELENRFSDYVFGGNSNDIFDLPVVKKGFWRLSTADNYAYHMGNVLEDWMNEEVSKLTENNKEVDFELKPVQSGSKLSYFIKTKLFGKFILNKKIMRFFLIWKGLEKEEAKNYLT